MATTKVFLTVGAVLLLLAFIALPVSAAVCPNPDCPNPDCPENKYQYRGARNADIQTMDAAICPNPDCPNPDCPENKYQYGRR